MEIRSGQSTKSQKILYSAMLLIHFGFLISGIKATVKEIENKRLLVLTLQCLPIKDTVREIENVEKEIGLIILINAVFFLYFMIMIIPDCIQFKLFVIVLCHNEILLQCGNYIVP